MEAQNQNTDPSISDIIEKAVLHKKKAVWNSSGIDILCMFNLLNEFNKRIYIQRIRYKSKHRDFKGSPQQHMNPFNGSYPGPIKLGGKCQIKKAALKKPNI